MRQPGRYTGALTPRQEEILDLILEGCSNVNIAARLGIREDTVKQQLTYIFYKHEVSTRLDLAVTVLRKRHAQDLARIRDEVTQAAGQASAATPSATT